VVSALMSEVSIAAIWALLRALICEVRKLDSCAEVMDAIWLVPSALRSALSSARSCVVVSAPMSEVSMAAS